MEMEFLAQHAGMNSWMISYANTQYITKSIFSIIVWCVGVVHACTCTHACSSLICAKYSLQLTQRNHTLIKTILIQVKLLSINLFPHTMNVLIIISVLSLLVYNACSIFNYYSTQGRHALYLMEHLTLNLV